MRTTIFALSTILLSWVAANAQTSNPDKPLQVIDSQGRIVGRLVLPQPGTAAPFTGAAAAVTGPGWSILLPVSRGGFPDVTIAYGTSHPVFMHTSTDCSGPRYLEARISDPWLDLSGLLPPVGFMSGGKLLVPIAPGVTTTFQSEEAFSGRPWEVDYTQPGQCSQAAPTGPGFYTITVDPATIGTPPFSVR